jgi:hypothetical protein
MGNGFKRAAAATYGQQDGHTTWALNVTGTRLTAKPSKDKRATAFEVRYEGRWVKVWTQTVEGGAPQMGIRQGGTFVPMDSDTVARLAVHKPRRGPFTSIAAEATQHARQGL